METFYLYLKSSASFAQVRSASNSRKRVEGSRRWNSHTTIQVIFNFFSLKYHKYFINLINQFFGRLTETARLLKSAFSFTRAQVPPPTAYRKLINFWYDSHCLITIKLDFYLKVGLLFRKRKTDSSSNRILYELMILILINQQAIDWKLSSSFNL